DSTPSQRPPPCFFMIPPPPRPPLFPYTTLFRSRWPASPPRNPASDPCLPNPPTPSASWSVGAPRICGSFAETVTSSESRWESWRSEEHTSELQSLRHLVCRLLLEKKKTNNQYIV